MGQAIISRDFFFFWEEEVDKNVLKLDSGDGYCSILNFQKSLSRILQKYEIQSN